MILTNLKLSPIDFLAKLITHERAGEPMQWVGDEVVGARKPYSTLLPEHPQARRRLLTTALYLTIHHHQFEIVPIVHDGDVLFRGEEGGENMKKLLLAMIFPFLTMGCMLAHTGMGKHDKHATPNTKEVEGDVLKASLEVPPLTASKKARIIVKVTDTKTGEIRKEVIVTGVFSPADAASDTKTVERKATRLKNGTFLLKHSFKKEGLYEIKAKVTPEKSLENPVEVSVTQEVAPKEKGHMGKSMLIIGGIAMGAMMALMMMSLL